jgi:two-component system phosphate regulon sensor histidine kinase PhoR
LTPDSAINYQLLSKSLLEALPLPVLIIDRALIIRDYNQRSLSLSPQTLHLQGQSLNTLLQDPALISLAQESIASGHVQKGHFEKQGTDLTWEVTVAPLTYQAMSEREQTQESGAVGTGLVPVHDPTFPTSTNSILPDTNTQYHCFAIIIEDLTETHRLERMQRDFLANISHELRTPLTSVRLLAETLEDVIDTNPDRAQEFVEKIETEVQYLSELVSELLELSRLESGQTIMIIEPVEAERLVREVMARMLPLAQRHRVSLGTDIHQGTTLVVADSKQITRVLVNLIHNAVKFTPSFGSVVIGTMAQTDQHTQCFFVRDTGVGISAEELPRVFERFYKTDRARSKAGFIGPGGGGTGLGLAIARHVIESHGGSIWAESCPGHGSTFSFTLPIATGVKAK